jgi:hypothetical protein
MAGTGPACTGLAGSHDPYTFDIAHFENLLSTQSGRIFVPDDRVQIKVIDVGQRGTIGLDAEAHVSAADLRPDNVFTKASDLQSYLESNPFTGLRIM